MRRIALISCSKSKQNYPCPARELYAPSRLFSLSYQYAKKVADQVYILSARYGLLAEEDVVAPYDLTLTDLPEHRQQDWANYVLRQMEERFDLKQDLFVILAGRNYYKNLLPHLAHTTLPLGNLRIGPRISFLEQELGHLSDGASHAHTNEFDNSQVLCVRLHQMIAELPRYTWKEIGAVPFRNGIYIVFEQGEMYHSLPRIVRIGTHTSPNRLRQRLKDHFVRENHNRSIFRKNIGKALLNQAHDPYLPTWSLDTSKPPYLGWEDPVREREVEQDVSGYLRRHFTFSVFQVDTSEQRLRLEAGMIASLHRASDFGPSESWLGLFSPEWEIRQSGMWLKQGLDAMPLTEKELCTLDVLLNGTPKAPENAVWGSKAEPAVHTKSSEDKVGTADILHFILDTLSQHQQRGEQICTLVSGEIHKSMRLSNKMPSVCNAMYKAMEAGNVVLHTTPSGKSSTIKICYQLGQRTL